MYKLLLLLLTHMNASRPLEKTKKNLYFIHFFVYRKRQVSSFPPAPRQIIYSNFRVHVAGSPPPFKHLFNSFEREKVNIVMRRVFNFTTLDPLICGVATRYGVKD